MSEPDPSRTSPASCSRDAEQSSTETIAYYVDIPSTPRPTSPRSCFSRMFRAMCCPMKSKHAPSDHGLSELSDYQSPLAPRRISSSHRALSTLSPRRIPSSDHALSEHGLSPLGSPLDYLAPPTLSSSDPLQDEAYYSNVASNEAYYSNEASNEAYYSNVQSTFDPSSTFDMLDCSFDLGAEIHIPNPIQSSCFSRVPQMYSPQIATADTGNVFEPISSTRSHNVFEPTSSTRSLQQSDSSEELSTESNESACSGARQTAIVQPTSIQQMNEQRKFARFRLREREGMISADHLPLDIWYEPNTLMTPAGDIVVGVSDNPVDFPNLHPGQRRISPVLVCLPHRASFSRPITLLCHRISSSSPEPTTSSSSSSPPDQDKIVKVLHSSTQLGDQTEWRTAGDALCILLQDGGISLTINHFCLYCVVEDNMSTFCEIGQRTVSVFLREKSVHEGEVFVKVTVMLSDRSEEAKTPFTGDKLVEQIPFPVVNKRPITLTLTLPATGAWTEHSNTTEKVFHEKFMSSGPRYHTDQNSFLLCSSQTNHLDFELTLKQCKGLERRITVCEKLDTVLPTPAVASPVSRPFDVNSEPESETVSSQWTVANGRCASEGDENASQIASSQFTTRNGRDVSGSYGCGISTNGNGIPLNGESTNALSNNSNCTNGGNARRLVDTSAGDDDGLELSGHGSSGAVGREHHCTNGGHGRVSTGAEGRGLDRVSTGAEGRELDRVCTGAEGRERDRVSTGAEGRECDRVTNGAEGRERDSSEKVASALVPNAPWPLPRSKLYTGEEWPLSYDVMQVIARRLDTEDGWMTLARLLKQDTLIPTITVRMQSSSPTVMLLHLWMLSTHIRREQALVQLVSALRSMQEPCVEDIADFIDESSSMDSTFF